MAGLSTGVPQFLRIEDNFQAKEELGGLTTTSYTIYKLLVGDGSWQIGPGEPGAQGDGSWHVYRRYQEFRRLNDSLRQEGCRVSDASCNHVFRR